MRYLIIYLTISVITISCQKEITPSNELTYLKRVKDNLKDSLTRFDFSNLNFSITTRTQVNDHYFLSIAKKGRDLSNDFVVIKTDLAGTILKGFIINLERETLQGSDLSIYNGAITMSSLARTSVIKSKVVNGFITALHSTVSNQRSLVVPVPKGLPEVVVTTYITTRSISYPEWINLQALFGITSGVYNLLDGVGGINGMGGINGGGGGSTTGGGGSFGGGGSIEIDYEPDDNPAIDISKYLKCFSSVPDNGAECSIEILADIPVDKDPQMFFNYSNGSPGHVFLQIRKSNGGQTVSQNIGFYPNQAWKTLLNPNAIDAKVVDNAGHEYNASLKRSMTPTQLKGILKNMEYLAKNKEYDIDEYNCTDFALEIFNSLSGNKTLVIPKYLIPAGISPANTPQGLYQKLKSMKDAGIEKDNITIPRVKGWVGNSTGVCN